MKSRFMVVLLILGLFMGCNPTPAPCPSSEDFFALELKVGKSGSITNCQDVLTFEYKTYFEGVSEKMAHEVRVLKDGVEVDKVVCLTLLPCSFELSYDETVFPVTISYVDTGQENTSQPSRAYITFPDGWD